MRTTTILFVVSLIVTALPGAAYAIGDQVEDRESLVEWYTRGDRFYLTNDGDQELVNFAEMREVRVCAQKRSRSIPLAVKYDGKESVISSGNCITVDAKSVKVSPAEELPANVELTGTVSHR